MRMTKKITSIVLAVMMVVSMMSVMAVTANAAVGDYVAEKDYLTFTALRDDSSVMFSNVRSGSDFKYNKNGDGWQNYNPDAYDRIELNKGEYVRFRGSDFVSNYNGSFSIRGKVAASGNIMSLRLDNESKSQGLTDECFHQMFSGCDGLITAPELPETTLVYDCYEGMFERCTNLTAAPALPATTLAYGCYSDMFNGCTSLTAAPALPATSLAYGCYHGMFVGCTSLTELPELPATSLAQYCYYGMFDGCSSIRISDEAGTFSGINYSKAYRIPTAGDATNASYALYNMFASTGGRFKGTPSLNTTYYIGKPVYTVKWKNGDNVIEEDTDVESGAAPSFDGETPTKASDSDKHYTFSGWSDGSNTYAANALPEVSGDVTYTAQFSETAHAYTLNPTFNWTQDASTGDWTCDTLTLSCTCGATQDYPVTGFFGASVVTCTANTDGSFTYSVSKKVDGTTYSDTKTLEANGVVKSVTQLKAAAKKGGSWNLEEDLTGVTDVQCANGFVLDGKNHTVTRHANVSTQAVFRTTANPAEITLKNLTIDGIAGQSDLKPAIATKMSNPSAGNVINLENVKITNYDFDEANNGVVLAWGQATVNMTNCDIRTDSNYDVWGGAASKVNVSGGKVGKVYLNAGTSQATVANGAQVGDIAVPEGYVLRDRGNGTYDVVKESEILKGMVEIDGYQRKIVKTGQSTADTGNDINTKGVRIVTKVDNDFLSTCDDYGYVVAKVTDGPKSFEQSNTNFAAMVKGGGNGEKTITCKGSANTISAYGEDYVTLAVNGMEDGQKVVARFYVVLNGKTYYANYSTYTGILAEYTEVSNG